MTRRWPRRRSAPRPNVSRQVVSPYTPQAAINGCPGRHVRRWCTLLGWVTLSGVLVTGLSLGYRELRPLLHDWFEVRKVWVRGTTHVTRTEVLDRLALASDATLLSVDTKRLEARLRTHAWIKGARVERRLAHSLEVQIEERRPAAVLRGPTVSLLLDEEGYVLGLSNEEKGLGLPLLTGIDANGLIQGDRAARAATESGVRLALLLQSAVPLRENSTAEGGGSLVRIDVSHPDNVMASVKGVQFQFGSSAFKEKWGRYQLIESEAAVGGHPGNNLGGRSQEIDLRYDGKVIVRERG